MERNIATLRRGSSCSKSLLDYAARYGLNLSDMLNVIVFFVIPIGLGWAIDKKRRQAGPYWILGFIIGLILYTIIIHPYSPEP